MNHNLKILKLANNCSLFDLVNFKSESFCIKNMLLNSILNRWDSKDTLDDVADKLGISKRTATSLEQLKVNNLVTVLNYIDLYHKNIAQKRLKESQRRYCRK